jgi:hypothetical protein
MIGIVDSNQKIITDGLVFHLDASQKNSYTGSGSSWIDVSKNNLTGTLFNSPTFNSGNGGYLLFNPTVANHYLRTSSGDAKLSIKSGTNTLGLTVATWIYIPFLTYDFHTIFECIDSTGNFDFSVRTNGTKIQFRPFGANYNVSVEANIPEATWCHLAMTVPSATANQSVTLTTYKNGTSQATGTVQMNATANYTYGQVGRSGNTGNYAYARFAIVQVYNKQLTSTEILQNHNANKSRFGL